MQLYEGIIKSWKSDKGFGFIQPNTGGKDIFIHIRDLKHKDYQPQEGDSVSFKIVADKDGKIRAYDAAIQGVPISRQHPRNKPTRNTSQQRRVLDTGIGVLFVYFIAALPFLFSVLMIIQRMDFLPFFIYALMSFLTFFVYAIDKTKAHKNLWRIPEQTMHLFELLGGWPGALITQRTIRHKNKKTSFQIIFWIIVITHLVAWVDVLFVNKLDVPLILNNMIHAITSSRVF